LRLNSTLLIIFLLIDGGEVSIKLHQRIQFVERHC